MAGAPNDTSIAPASSHALRPNDCVTPHLRSRNMLLVDREPMRLIAAAKRGVKGKRATLDQGKAVRCHNATLPSSLPLANQR